MLIIDAQVHVWGSGKPSAQHRQTSIFTAGELIKEMDEAGVNGAVLHPPSWDPGSNEMAIEAAKNIRTNSAVWDGFRSMIRRSGSGSRPGSSNRGCLGCVGL
jgi:predicted TIM-barrel fold metal-dependent hydrolase